MRLLGKQLLSVILLASAASAPSAAHASPSNGASDWPQYGGDNGFNRYAPLDQINPSNADKVRILWTRPAIDPALKQQYPTMRAGKYFRSTPIVVNGVMYVPNGVGLIEAMDPATGKSLWSQKPFNNTRQEVAGQSSRGVAYWTDKKSSRIISVRGAYLYAVDAKTGAPITSFGTAGRVSLNRTADAAFNMSGGPTVAGDVIIVGGAGSPTQDYSTDPAGVGESVRAYDVRTGKLLWAFDPVPQEGDPARSSWGKDSVKVAGAMGSYGQISADEKLSIVYVPFSAVNPPSYGGWRPGDNLYGTSLVALDLKTGRKLWHHQLVHHDVWDRDLASPPVLGDVIVDGKPRQVVMQTGKQPFLYTYDRKTGEPIWPIVETPVPQSTVPGEVTSPTQPIPSKPEALDRVTMLEGDLIDFTPEIKAKALEIYRKYVPGQLFAPPSVHEAGKKQGTLTLSGTDGGGNWQTGAFDPETGIYYGSTTTSPANYALVKPTIPGAKQPYTLRDAPDTWNVDGPDGLPLAKPPYGRITAVDMNTGERKWMIANGDGPRDHPALKALNLPALGIPGRAALAITKRLIMAGEGSDAVFLSDIQKGFGDKFHFYDKASGREVGRVQLPGGLGTTGAPITYMIDGKQYVVVAVSSTKGEPTWVAMGL